MAKSLRSDYVGVSVANARSWQVRLLCAPKRQVDDAFFHVARMCPLAFLPNPVDLVVVAAQIERRVKDREEKDRDYRNAYRPHAHLPEIRRRRNTCRTGIRSTAFGPAH
jgi:hypothetical protein